MKPRRVLLYSDAPVFGGGERYLEAVAVGLIAQRVGVRVVLAREAALDDLHRRLNHAGIPVTRLPRMVTLGSPMAFARVAAHLAWQRPHILHANLVDPRACNAALVAAKLTGHTHIVATEHLPASPFDTGATPARHALAMASIKRFIVVAHAGVAALTARGIASARIRVVPNGIVDPGVPDADARADARVKLLGGDAPRGAPIVAFIGRLVEQKQPGRFLEAAARVAAGTDAADGPAARDARFVVIGDGPLRPALEADAAQRGLTSRVRFLGHRDDVIALLAGCDLLVLTSDYEGLPLTVLEAMGRGVPVVAPAIAGMDEAVAADVTGRLVEPGSAAATATAISGLLAMPATRTAMGVAARSRMLANFSVDQMVRGTLAVYEDVLSRR